jgi:ADP-dependent NAD(P)H-hydrate dehydratase / NAD(P)H-hydrate epimerase
MTVRVVTAAQASARDRAAIDSGIPSRALMQRAGAAAASEIVRQFGHRLTRGIAVFAGSGNNGGDAWVVAGALAAVGIRVRVVEVGDARTDDARAERELARRLIEDRGPTGGEEIVIDGILGTGARGAPRGAVAEAIRRVSELRADGASVVALDVPSGVDASTGEGDVAVTADLTITFGTMKRGALVRRERCGRIVVVDIGLGPHASLADEAPTLVDRRWVDARVPPIVANAHKGTRRRVVIVGGSRGMAGACMLAAQAALRTGVGMARVVVDPASISPSQTAVPAALTRPWPESDDEIRETICDWAHAVVIGPGLGRGDAARELIERILHVWRGPVVIDADALTAFEGNAAALGTLLGGRKALVTPHVVEFSRLTDMSVDDVLRSPFDAGLRLAKTLGCVVLLKGVPTVLTAPDGRSLVSASGTPALATGGSGDVLSGIAGTLVAQIDDPLEAAACAAWVHGRAAEIADGGDVRGTTLEDVLGSLSNVWREPLPTPRPPVLAELPPIGAHGDGRVER